jgi:hypothetical protein
MLWIRNPGSCFPESGILLLGSGMTWKAGSGVPDPKHRSYTVLAEPEIMLNNTEPAALTSGNIIRLLLPSTRSISTDVIIVSKSEIRNKINNFKKISRYRYLVNILTSWSLLSTTVCSSKFNKVSNLEGKPVY